ncbi:MAG: 2-amino-4-hydroxy-6-hydroxymethyldihydropteridine diphosphokinase [Candidatus Bipolaricaulota bacterium]
METAFVGLGSNLGAREKNIATAVELLRQSENLQVFESSSLYETEPVGPRFQPWFLNVVVKLGSLLEPTSLLNQCKVIERRVGRYRTLRWGPRVIDLDVLLVDGYVVQNELVTLPHPQLQERRFVLEPLAELAPQWVHPGNCRSIKDLLGAVDDEKKVIKLARRAF